MTNHYEARILANPRNPQDSEWEHVSDGDGGIVKADTYDDCCAALELMELDGDEKRRVVIAQVITIYHPIPESNELD